MVTFNLDTIRGKLRDEIKTAGFTNAFKYFHKVNDRKELQELFEATETGKKVISGGTIRRVGRRTLEAQEQGGFFDVMHDLEIVIYYERKEDHEAEKTFQDRIDALSLAVQGSTDVWPVHPEGQAQQAIDWLLGVEEQFGGRVWHGLGTLTTKERFLPT